MVTSVSKKTMIAMVKIRTEVHKPMGEVTTLHPLCLPSMVHGLDLDTAAPTAISAAQTLAQRLKMAASEFGAFWLDLTIFIYSLQSLTWCRHKEKLHLNLG